MWTLNTVREFLKCRMFDELNNAKENADDKALVIYIGLCFINYYNEADKSIEIPGYSIKKCSEKVKSIIYKYKDAINAFYSENSNKWQDIKFANADDLFDKLSKDFNEEHEFDQEINEIYENMKKIITIIGENHDED